MNSKLKMENRDFGKVSVIIPTWNREKTVIKAIESVLKQTYKNLEILVCNDGSTDNTKNIISKINDKRVIWVEGEHSGLPAVSRNRGIDVAKGEWIAFLDDDDIWEENKIEEQLNWLLKKQGLATCSNGLTIKNSKRMIDRNNWKSIGFLEMLDNNLVICSSVLISKKILLKSGKFNENPSLRATEDYELWLRIMFFERLFFIDKPLVLYNDDHEASIRKLEKDEWKLRIEVFKELTFWLKNKAKSFIDFKYLVFIYFGRRYYSMSLRHARNINIIERAFIKTFK